MVTHDIGEAITMGDKVVVLSKRPAKIKNVYTITNNDKKMPSENRNSPEFMKFYNLIWEDLDHYER